MRKSYSPEFKTQVVREVLREDKTLSQIAAMYEVHPNQVAQWRVRLARPPYPGTPAGSAD